MKYFFNKIKNFLKLLILCCFMCNQLSAKNMSSNASPNNNNIYQFSFKSFDNKEIKLTDFKNKVILIVNTASKCGFTNQFNGLEKIYQKYKDRGFEIIGVPSNDFGGQEPLNNEEIQKFCKFNYGVNFIVVQKEIVSGKNAHPFYAFASNKFGILGSPKWNFHKYLINKNGELINYFISNTSPESEKIISAIEAELNK